MYAVIKSGGSQHRVAEGDVLKVDRIHDAEPGSQVELEQVLLVHDGTDLRIGRPRVEDARVVATIIDHDRERKILVFKKKRRKQYRRTQGHRQPITRLRIEKIISG
jgi:large subunit ribosomal protein L21